MSTRPGSRPRDTPMPPNPEDLDLLALDALPPDEAEALERRLAELDPASRAEADRRIAATREVMTRLAEPYETQPPAELRERILTAVADARGSGRRRTAVRHPAGGDPDGSGSTQGAPAGRSRGRLGRATAPLLAAAAVLALLAGVGIGRYLVPAGDDAPAPQAGPDTSVPDGGAPDGAGAGGAGGGADAETARLLQPLQLAVTRGRTPQGATLTLMTSRPADCAVFTADGLAGVPEDRAYQLWLMPRDGQPRSAGLLGATTQDGNPGAASPGVMHSMTGLGDAAAVGLSVEPAGGSEAPTGPIVGTVEMG